MSVEVGTDVVRCHHCGQDVLIEAYAVEGREIQVVTWGGEVVRREHLVEVHHTADTKAAIQYHSSGRCNQ